MFFKSLKDKYNVFYLPRIIILNIPRVDLWIAPKYLALMRPKIKPSYCMFSGSNESAFNS